MPPTAIHDAAPDDLRAAFRELHGRRLHGFALLLVLGEAPLAARLAGDALAAGTKKLEELRHPERAAAWLRARVVRQAGSLRVSVATGDRRLATLRQIGAEPAVVAGLVALTVRERAAFIAASIERLDRRDVAAVVDVHGPALDHLLARARHRYAAAHAAAAPSDDVPGPLVAALEATVARALR